MLAANGWPAGLSAANSIKRRINMVRSRKNALIAMALCVCMVGSATAQEKRMHGARMSAARGEMPEMWLFKASEIVGKEVRNNTDQKLGRIDELAVDSTTGEIAYAVLSFGGFMGMGDKLFAIPWDALQLKPRDRAK